VYLGLYRNDLISRLFRVRAIEVQRGCLNVWVPEIKGLAASFSSSKPKYGGLEYDMWTVFDIAPEDLKHFTVDCLNLNKVGV
jgi:hypothetical protein